MVFAGQEVRVGDAFTSWTTYTPTFLNVTLGTGATVTGKWRRVADFMILLRFQLTLGTGGSVTGNLGVTIPGGLSGEGTLRQTLPVWAFDSSASGYYSGVAVLQNGGGPNFDRFGGPSNTVGWNGTTPFTWASGDIIQGQGWVDVTT
jgi:hypothetical protein